MRITKTICDVCHKEIQEQNKIAKGDKHVCIKGQVGDEVGDFKLDISKKIYLAIATRNTLLFSTDVQYDICIPCAYELMEILEKWIKESRDESNKDSV